jgi:hypothetical protein
VGFVAMRSVSKLARTGLKVPLNGPPNNV